MRVYVRKWGNSASVRLPASVLVASKLRVDQAVDVREESGRIIIEPVAAPEFNLDQLLSTMDPVTFPDDVDFGRPVGDEVW